MTLLPVLQLECYVPGVNNGYVSESSGSQIETMVPVRSNVTLSCYSGYQLVGTNQLQCIVTIGAVPDWSGSFPTCQGL